MPTLNLTTTLPRQQTSPRKFMKATKEQVREYEQMALERGGSVGGPAMIGEAVASCRLDGETQIVGQYEIWIPGWRPTSLNRLMYAKVRDRIKLKANDSEIVGVFAHTCKVPKATCRRRVSLAITLGPRWRQFDDDNALKGILDGLVTCGRLVNDNATWCERGEIIWRPRGSGPCGTLITLEDRP